MNNKNMLIAALLCAVALSGCHGFGTDKTVFDRYYATTLKLTKQEDLLPILAGKKETLSRSGNIVASWGQQDKGSVIWFNMAAFSENDKIAVRKYCFAADENAKSILTSPVQNLRFDCEVVLDAETLGKSFENENQRKIAILSKVLEHFKNDIDQMRFDSQTLHSCTMMTNQAIQAVLQKLMTSPALAAELENRSGLDFDHMTLGPGRMRMLIENDIVKVKIKIGTDWLGIQTFPDHSDVIDM